MYFKKNLFLNNFILFFIINNNFSMESKTYLHNFNGIFYASGEKVFKNNIFYEFTKNRDFFDYFSEEINSPKDSNLKFFKDYFIKKIEISKEKNILSNFLRPYPTKEYEIDEKKILDMTNSLIENIKKKNCLYEILNCIPSKNIIQLSFDEQDEKEENKNYTHRFYSFSLKDLFGEGFNSYNNRYDIQKFFLKEFDKENKTLSEMKRNFFINKLYDNFKEAGNKSTEAYINKLLELNLFPEYNQFLINKFLKQKDAIDNSYLKLISDYNNLYYYLQRNFKSIAEIIDYHKNKVPILQYVPFPNQLSKSNLLVDFMNINNEKNPNWHILIHELGHVAEKFLHNNGDISLPSGFICGNLNGLFSYNNTTTIGVTKYLKFHPIICNLPFGNCKLSGYACELNYLMKAIDPKIVDPLHKEKFSDIAFLMLFTKLINPFNGNSGMLFLKNNSDFAPSVNKLLNDPKTFDNLKPDSFSEEELKNIIFVDKGSIFTNLNEVFLKNLNNDDSLLSKKFKNFFKENKIEDNDKKLNYFIAFLLQIKKDFFDSISKENLNKITNIGEKIIGNNNLGNEPFCLFLENFYENPDSSILEEEKKEFFKFLSESGQPADKFVELKIPKGMFTIFKK